MTLGPFTGGLINEREPHLLKADEAQVAENVEVVSGALAGARKNLLVTQNAGANLSWLGTVDGNLAYSATAYQSVPDRSMAYRVSAGANPETLTWNGGLVARPLGIATPAAASAAESDPASSANPFVSANVRSRKFAGAFALTAIRTDSIESNPQFISRTDLEFQKSTEFPSGGGFQSNPALQGTISLAEGNSALADDQETRNELDLAQVKVTPNGTPTAQSPQVINVRLEWRPIGGSFTVYGSTDVTFTSAAEATATIPVANKIKTYPTGKILAEYKFTLTGGGTLSGVRLAGKIYFPLAVKITPANDSAITKYRVWRDNGTGTYIAAFERAGTGVFFFDGGKQGADVNGMTAYTTDPATLLTWNVGGFPDPTGKALYTEDHSPAPGVDTTRPRATLIATALHAGSILMLAQGKTLYWSRPGKPQYLPTFNTKDYPDTLAAIVPMAGHTVVFTPSGTYLVSGSDDADLSFNTAAIGHHIRSDAGKSAVWTPDGILYLAREGLARTDGYRSDILPGLSDAYLAALTVNAAAYFDDRYLLFCADRTLVVDFRAGIGNVRFSTRTIENGAIRAAVMDEGALIITNGTHLYQWEAA